MAFAKSAWSLSKTGSPHPAGTPRATKTKAPPTVSPSFFTSAMRSSMRLAVSGWGQRTG